MLNAIIIDDEENARITLAALISQFTPDVHIVAQCANVPDGVIAIHKHQPHIVFLDIEMPEYNGFELLNFFKTIDFHIIFVTAYAHYAVRAFEISAVDYLLKPVEISSLQNAIAKTQKLQKTEDSLRQLTLMQQSLANPNLSKIAVPTNDGLLFVDVNQLHTLEADRVYTNISLADNSKHLVSRPLRVYEDLLADKIHFFRPHRSFLINVHYIKKYLRSDSTIVMDNDTHIPVSRERKPLFDQLLKQLRLTF